MLAPSPCRSRPRPSAASGISSATLRTCRRPATWSLFDRSWYNRAGVERVMNFCTPAQTDSVPARCARLRGAAGARRHPPVQVLSRHRPRDAAACASTSAATTRSSAGRSPTSILPPSTSGTTTAARRAKSSSARARKTSPWIVVRANDQRRARLEAIRWVLFAFRLCRQGRARRRHARPQDHRHRPDYFQTE